MKRNLANVLNWHRNINLHCTFRDVCIVCKSHATLLCTSCQSCRFCSEDCRAKDTPLHQLLCADMARIPDRPSDKHRLVIIFPNRAIRPYFAWLEKGLSRLVSHIPLAVLTPVLTVEVPRLNSIFRTTEFHSWAVAEAAKPTIRAGVEEYEFTTAGGNDPLVFQHSEKDRSCFPLNESIRACVKLSHGQLWWCSTPQFPWRGSVVVSQQWEEPVSDVSFQTVVRTVEFFAQVNPPLWRGILESLQLGDADEMIA